MPGPKFEDELRFTQRLIANDEDAWMQFSTEYMPQVKAIAYKYWPSLGNKDPEDIAQEVYLKLRRNGCKALKRFKGKSRLKTYVVRITMNYCCSIVRRKNKKNEKHPTIPLIDLPEGDVPSSNNARKEKQRRLRVLIVNEELDSVIRRLDGKDKELFHILKDRIMQQLGQKPTNKEIATELGITEKGVEKRWERLRKKIRDID